MGAVPRHKGTGILPVVTALKAHPQGPRAVPAALQHYLSDHLVPTEWYPEQDYSVLLHSLADVLHKSGMADAWDYFGRVAAQRDLKGSQELVPPQRRVKTTAIYRPFAGAEGTSAASSLLRLGKLWTLYHDTGQLLAGRSTSDDNCAILRLVEYQRPSPSHLTMQTAYFSEYSRIVGREFEASVVRATGRGDAYDEWLCRFERTAEISTSLALLPLLP